jgi:hypothetical protein
MGRASKIKQIATLLLREKEQQSCDWKQKENGFAENGTAKSHQEK